MTPYSLVACDVTFKTCGTYGREMRVGIWNGNLKEEDHLEDLDVDNKIFFIGF
jgi:hypothetical protein